MTPINPTPPNAEALAAAHRSVSRKLGFYTHLGIYFIVHCGLMLLNLRHPQQPFWALGPLLGWGIGLLFHGLRVFLRIPPGWKQRMLEHELRNR